jgi:hypothetical protein
MVEAAITKIGSDPEGAPHRAAMHACKRHRRARSTYDGVGLGDGGCRRALNPPQLWASKIP